MKTSARRQGLLLPASFLMAFLLGYYISAYQYSLLQISAQLAFDSTQAGIMIGVNYGSYAFLPVLFGYFADRRGKKGFLIAACFMLLAGQLLLFFARSYSIMLLITFLAGSGFGAMQALYLSMLADAYPTQIIKYTNFSQTLFGLGAFFAPLTAAAMEGRGYSWQNAFWPSIVILGLAILLLLLTHVETTKVLPQAVSSGKGKAATLFRSPLFYLIMFWMVAYIGVEVPTAANAKAFFVQELNAPGYSALALSLFWIMMVPSRILMGLVRKHHSRVSVVLSLLALLMTLAIPTVKSPVAALVFFALSGFFCGPFWPTIFAASQKAFPQATSTAGSFCNAFSGLSGFVFSTLFGVVSRGHSLSFVYYVIGAIGVVLLLLTLLYSHALKRSGLADA